MTDQRHPSPNNEDKVDMEKLSKSESEQVPPPPPPVPSSGATAVDQDELGQPTVEQASTPMLVLPSISVAAPIVPGELRQPTPEHGLPRPLRAVAELEMLRPDDPTELGRTPDVPEQTPSSTVPQWALSVSATPGEEPTPQEQAKVFRCKLCGRTFSSHQALGGHCAAHARGLSSSGRSANNGHRPSVNNHSPPGEHVCKHCGQCFSSGQALGGHMRLHWDGVSKGKGKSSKVPKPGPDVVPQTQELNLGGFCGSTSNSGSHMRDLGCVGLNPVSNGYSVLESINRKRSERFEDGRDPTQNDARKRSRRAQGEANGWGSNSDMMRLGRSGSGSESESESEIKRREDEAFKKKMQHGSNYFERRYTSGVDAVGVDGHIRSNNENNGINGGTYDNDRGNGHRGFLGSSSNCCERTEESDRVDENGHIRFNSGSNGEKSGSESNQVGEEDGNNRSDDDVDTVLRLRRVIDDVDTKLRMWWDLEREPGKDT